MLPRAHFLAALAVAAVSLDGCRNDSNPATNPQAPPAVGSLQVEGCVTGLRVEFIGELDPRSVTSQSFYVQGVAGLTSYDFAGRAATFVPNAPFVPGTTYDAILTTNITSSGGTYLVGQIDWSFACVDTTPPSVVMKTPVGSGVSPLVQPSVTFSKALDPISITPQTVFISGAPSTPAYDSSTDTVTLAPSHTLYPGRTYQVNVGPSVQDLSGNGLGVAVTWSFQTRPPASDWAARVITPPIPSMAPCSTELQLRLAPAFNVATSDLDVSPFDIDGLSQLSSSYDATTRVLTVAPVDQAFMPAGMYAVAANGGLQDVYGDTPFDDGSTVAQIAVVPTCATPTVATVPDSSGVISCSATTSMTFSVPMDPVTTSAAITLQDLTAGGYVVMHAPLVPAQVSLDPTGLIATIAPMTSGSATAPLQDAHQYWLAVSSSALATGGAMLASAGGWTITASCP